MNVLLQQLVNGVALGAGYALFALGFTLIFGVNRILNLAQGAVFTWAALAGYYTATRVGGGLVLAVLVGAVVGGIVSVLLDLIAFRPLRRKGASEFAALISSLGGLIILQNLALRATDARFLAFPDKQLPGTTLNVGELAIAPSAYVITGVAIAFAVGLWLYLTKTQFGVQIRAVAADEDTSGILGINPNWIYVQVFFISGMLSGVAGVLIAASYKAVNFSMGEPYLLVGLAVIILGGMGSIPGAIVGGLVFGIVHSLTVQYISSSLSEVLPFVMIIVILLIRPNGIFGAAVSERRVGRA